MPEDELTPLRIAELLSAAPPPRVAAILVDLADLVASYVATEDGSELERVLADYRTLEAELPPEWRPSAQEAIPPPSEPRRQRRRHRLKCV